MGDARQAALGYRRMVERGQDPRQEQPGAAEPTTFGAFALERYLPFARQKKRSADGDASKLRYHLLPRFGHKALLSSAMTTRYAHLGEDTLRESSQVVGRLVGAADVCARRIAVRFQ